MIGLLLKVVKDASTELPANSDPLPYSEPNTNKANSPPATALFKAAVRLLLALSYTSMLYS